MIKRAFTFPGQGSQAIGMGLELFQDFAEAKQVFEEVDEALGESLSTLIFEGSEDKLRLTRNAQPALMAVSLAAIKVLEAKGISIEKHGAFVAGHSLGEYSALCAAGTFSISDAARLLRTRGDAMQRAVEVGAGSMAAILGLELPAVIEIAKTASQSGVCEVANDNAPGQVVISGASAAIERAVELAKTAGAKRAIMLPVSAPFHCSLMAPAAEEMEQALALVQMKDPVVPIICNVLANPLTGAAQIRKCLIEQVTSMVRWREVINWLGETGEVTQLLEVGSGRVLTGLARRINRNMEALAVGTPADIEAIVEKIAGENTNDENANGENNV